MNPLRTSPIQAETKCQYFRFSVKIFSRSALAWGGGGGEKIVPARLEPAVGGPDGTDIILKY